MDPFSAVAAVVRLADVALHTVSALIEYTNNTQNASADRKLLAKETYILSKMLERLRTRLQSPGFDDKWLEERKDLVRQFARAYDELAASLNFDVLTGHLKQESRLKTIRTLSKWSFTKNEVYSLLERVTRLQQYANILLLEEQHSLIETIDQRQQEATDKKQRQAILSWLSPLQMTQTHLIISGGVEDGSGRWFLTSQKFLAWQSGEQKLLWCSGIPGAGKTVMASIVVDHLRRQRAQKQLSENVGIAVMYLRYNDPEQTLENLLASLLKQLAQEQDTVPSLLQGLFEQHRDHNMALSLEDITNVLTSLTETYAEVFFVVDTLDECSDEIRWELLEKLQQCQPKIHLMITSRFLDSIGQELEDFERLEIKADKADLELFIDRRIQKNKNLRRIVEKSPRMRTDIKDAVVKMSVLDMRLGLKCRARAA
ncbi:MAG: hypothetical protein LQ347_006261 [Umbilicaria vellea]|nr:MAG: hypothetical protein LQ347_006261 [Umbilicaria vellea]